MSYRLKDATNITLGPAEILVSESLPYISDINPILTQDDYFGYSEVTNIVYTTSYNEITDVSTNNLIDNMKSDRVSCTMEMQTVELSKNIISLLMGILPSNTLNTLSFNKIPDIDVRVEINYNYADKVKKAQFIFPRVRIRSGLNLSLTSDAEVNQSLYMYALPIYTAPWEDHNLGIVHLHGF